MKRITSSRVHTLIVGFLLCVLPSPASAEILKIVVNDTIHPITD